jgi:threonine/homoserine/homoserine lactone efflux protein
VTDPLIFFLAVATILFTPGPTNTLMATAGATGGIRPSLPLLGAELSGYLIAIMAIRILLGPIIQAYPAVGVALKIAVAFYLVWLAIKLWRNPIRKEQTGRPVTFRAVLITTLLNPKALIFALSVIPQQTSNLVWYVSGFAVTVLAAGGAWIVLGYALGAAAGERSGWLPRIAAVALVAFAGLIAKSAL